MNDNQNAQSLTPAPLRAHGSAYKPNRLRQREPVVRETLPSPRKRERVRTAVFAVANDGMINRRQS